MHLKIENIWDYFLNICIQLIYFPFQCNAMPCQLVLMAVNSRTAACTDSAKTFIYIFVWFVLPSPLHWRTSHVNYKVENMPW